jgi:DNA invertase Pin-like site-specific DNA recombinase
MRPIAYIRVSSRGQNFDLQRDAITKAAAARGDEIVEWRAEKKSAKTMDRPVLQSILADARSGAVKKLYAFKIDRLTRTGVADTFAVVTELRRGGCELVAVADNLTIKPETDDITSEVLLFAWGLAAKLERVARNERTAAAREVIEAKGGRWGRPPRMTPQQVAKARQLAAKGRSVRQIAIAMKIPRATIGRALADGFRPTLRRGGVRET